MKSTPPSKAQLVATHRALAQEIKSAGKDKVKVEQVAEKAWMLMTLFLEIRSKKDSENIRDTNNLFNQNKKLSGLKEAYGTAYLLHIYHYSPWDEGDNSDALLRSAQSVATFVKHNMGKL